MTPTQRPCAAGMRLPKKLRTLQTTPLWRDAYGIRVPEDLRALYHHMAEVRSPFAAWGLGLTPEGLGLRGWGLGLRGCSRMRCAPLRSPPPLRPSLTVCVCVCVCVCAYMCACMCACERPHTLVCVSPTQPLGIFDGVQTVHAVIGDGDLPIGLEEGLCARGLYADSQAKITVAPHKAVLPGQLAGPHPPRENPFPVSYLVRVISVTAPSRASVQQRLASAHRRRRRANACYACALVLLDPSHPSLHPHAAHVRRRHQDMEERRGGEGGEGAVCGKVREALEEARVLYLNAIHLANMCQADLRLASPQVCQG
jgi:hypothetical protein